MRSGSFLDQGLALEPQLPGVPEFTLVSGQHVGFLVALIHPVRLVVYLHALSSIQPSPHIVYHYLLSVAQAIHTLAQQLPGFLHPTLHFFQVLRFRLSLELRSYELNQIRAQAILHAAFSFLRLVNVVRIDVFRDSVSVWEDQGMLWREGQMERALNGVEALFVQGAQQLVQGGFSISRFAPDLDPFPPPQLQAQSLKYIGLGLCWWFVREV